MTEGDRFTDKQRTWARREAEAYEAKVKLDDDLEFDYSARPPVGHPSPHAHRDKTEEYDMRKGIVADPRTGQGDARGPRVEFDFDNELPDVPNELTFKEELGQGADGGGQRLNAGKNRIELLPEIWLWALADVMTQGSKKYDARNWEKGMDWSSMIGCIHRHMAKFQSGQRYDGPEFDKEKGTTGCHELAMVAWNALALMFYDIYVLGKNDLPVYEDLNHFLRVNAATSDLKERIHEV